MAHCERHPEALKTAACPDSSSDSPRSISIPRPSTDLHREYLVVNVLGQIDCDRIDWIDDTNHEDRPMEDLHSCRHRDSSHRHRHPLEEVPVTADIVVAAVGGGDEAAIELLHSRRDDDKDYLARNSVPYAAGNWRRSCRRRRVSAWADTWPAAAVAAGAFDRKQNRPEILRPRRLGTSSSCDEVQRGLGAAN